MTWGLGMALAAWVPARMADQGPGLAVRVMGVSCLGPAGMAVRGLAMADRVLRDMAWGLALAVRVMGVGCLGPAGMAVRGLALAVRVMEVAAHGYRHEKGWALLNVRLGI